jgi:hypothetical protein
MDGDDLDPALVDFVCNVFGACAAVLVGLVVLVGLYAVGVL